MLRSLVGRGEEYKRQTQTTDAEEREVENEHHATEKKEKNTDNVVDLATYKKDKDDDGTRH